MVALLAQVVEKTIDPPAKAPTGLLAPFLVIVAVIGLVVAAALIRRARHTDEE